MLNSLEKHPPELIECLNRYLNNKSTLVVLESAKALCHLRKISEKVVENAVEALTDMLNSHLTVERFGAMRVLNSVVDRYPIIVGSRAEVELEHLAQDNNANIAVLAITTLLKTGVEASIDRLFTQIESFMQNIGDDLKVVLVNAIKSLCLKFPKKHETLMSFLSKALREEGGFEYKKTIVDSMLILMKEIPAAQAQGSHSCSVHATCDNKPGTYKCMCKDGYQGDGKQCTVNSCSVYVYGPGVVDGDTDTCTNMGLVAGTSCNIKCDEGYEKVGTGT
eukprot:UN23097